MKKKFLALICFLLLVSVLLCSCTIVIERPTENTGDDPESGAQNGTSQTTKQTDNTKKPTPNGEQESQKIEKINGMSARDLVKNFYKEYASLTSLDIVIDTFTTVEGERYQIHEELKLNGSDVYMLMDVDGEEIKIWNVGGVLYVDGQGEKVRADIDIEEYTGTSINDMLTSYLSEQLPDTATVHLPIGDLPYEVSGNNVDGFIVTITLK